MEDLSLQSEKLDPILLDMLQKLPSQTIPVIIQTVDGLQNDDKQLLASVGGKIKDNLYIINAFSADVSTGSLSSLVLSPRVVKIYYDAEIHAVNL